MKQKALNKKMSLKGLSETAAPFLKAKTRNILRIEKERFDFICGVMVLSRQNFCCNNGMMQLLLFIKIDSKRQAVHV